MKNLHGQVFIVENTYPSHAPVVVVFIFISWLYEREHTIIASHVTSETYEHLQNSNGDQQSSYYGTRIRERGISHFSKRRMDIKEERPVDVVTSHLSKVRLIPTDDKQNDSV